MYRLSRLWRWPERSRIDAGHTESTPVTTAPPAGPTESTRAARLHSAGQELDVRLQVPLSSQQLRLTALRGGDPVDVTQRHRADLPVARGGVVTTSSARPNRWVAASRSHSIR